MTTLEKEANKHPAKFANAVAIKYTLMGWHPSFAGDLAKLCQEFSDESLNEYGLGVVQDRLDQMTEVCKDVSVFLLADGKPCGVIAGFLVANMTNGNPAVQEVIWYVRKANRSHGKKLMTAFEQLAKDRGATALVMGLMSNSMSERLDKFYRRLGYIPFETQYMKELTCQQPS